MQHLHDGWIDQCMKSIPIPCSLSLASSLSYCHTRTPAGLQLICSSCGLIRSSFFPSMPYLISPLKREREIERGLAQLAAPCGWWWWWWWWPICSLIGRERLSAKERQREREAGSSTKRRIFSLVGSRQIEFGSHLIFSPRLASFRLSP